MSDKEITILSNVKARENHLIRNVYGYMTAGLALTALTAYLTSTSRTMLQLLYGNPFLSIVLVVVQLGLVFFLSSRIEKMARTTAIVTFLAYSALMGLSMSSIFLVYAGTVIYQAFFSTALMFLAATLWATFTKRKLASGGNYGKIGHVGLIIASLINLFFYSSTMNLIISAVGVVLFVGLTAWDTRKIVEMNREYGSEMTIEEYTKLGIIGALDLYLDFLNIFMYLLRIFGHSSRD